MYKSRFVRILFYSIALLISGKVFTFSDLEKQDGFTDKTNYSDYSSYLWSSYFKEHDNDFLVEQLNFWNVNKLFLSPGNSSQEKVNDFLNQASVNNINVLRLIGENSYAKDSSGVQKMINKLIDSKSKGFNGVHLDIEPHTFDDYEENINFYIERWIELYASAKVWCIEENMDLSVSIPMHIPQEVAEFLAQNDIESYIMAYENTNQNTLLNRTSDLREILGENFVWVLRVSDFNTLDELYYAEHILWNNDIPQIGLYDFSMLESKIDLIN